MLSRRMSVLARMAEKLNLNFEICTSDGRNHQGTDFFRAFAHILFRTQLADDMGY